MLKNFKTTGYVLFAFFVLLPASGIADVDTGYPPLTQVAAADTTPTNLWLIQAMMAEMLGEPLATLPPAPARLILKPGGRHEATPLLQELMFDCLSNAGYELFLDDSDLNKDGKPTTEVTDDAQVLVKFGLSDVALSYPASGRRFHLWRQWVDRELAMTMFVTVQDYETGQVLMNERMVRRYADRIPADRFDGVSSPAYQFTQADVKASGIRGVLENVVVIGSLAGLVAVYFANTSN